MLSEREILLRPVVVTASKSLDWRQDICLPFMRVAGNAARGLQRHLDPRGVLLGAAFLGFSGRAPMEQAPSSRTTSPPPLWRGAAYAVPNGARVQSFVMHSNDRPRPSLRKGAPKLAVDNTIAKPADEGLEVLRQFFVRSAEETPSGFNL